MVGVVIDLFDRSLYRRALRLSLDWAVHRNLWRGQAVYIRSLFDAKKDVKDPRQQRVGQHMGLNATNKEGADVVMVQILFMETEKLLEKFKHPDPYRPPTAPGGE